MNPTAFNHYLRLRDLWRRGSGEFVPPEDLSSPHIENCLALMERAVTFEPSVKDVARVCFPIYRRMEHILKARRAIVSYKTKQMFFADRYSFIPKPGPIKPPPPLTGYLGGGQYRTNSGVLLKYVHDERQCLKQRGCPIHHPSMHPLRDAPTHWEHGIFYRKCRHGQYHPDKDHLDFVERTRGVDAALDDAAHPCDGCCTSVSTT